MHTIPDDGLPLDFTSVRGFREALPSLHRSTDSLRWELRWRRENGLLAVGVVLERFAHPGASRQTLLISPTRYVARLRRQARDGSVGRPE
jgi:hypothetical protein